VSGLVEAARFNKHIEGELARTYLESHGIHAVVFDVGLNISEGGGLATAVRVMVLDEHLDSAREALREYRP
jgi:Putative prokaryotic signal transducing protein